MRNSYHQISPSVENVNALRKLIEYPSFNFGDLVREAGLSKETDFVEADLVGVDFTGSDLRGFDFTGADLRNSFGVDFKFDETTILSRAFVDGSVFALEKEKRDFFDLHRDQADLFLRLQKEHWSHGAIWVSENLKRSSKNFDASAKIAKFLFSHVEDQTYKNQILYFLRNTFDSKIEYRDFLISQAANPNESYRTIRGVIDILSRSFSNDETVRKMLLLYLQHENPEIRRICVRPVMGKEFFKRNRDLILPIVRSETDASTRSLFTSSFAAIDGKVASVLLFRSDTKSFHDYAEPIDNRIFEVLVRGVIRARNAARAAQNIGRNSSGVYTGAVSIRDLVHGFYQLDEKLNHVSDLGLPLKRAYSVKQLHRTYMPDLEREMVEFRPLEVS